MLDALLRYLLYDQTSSFCSVYFSKTPQGLESGKTSPVVRYYEYEADRDFCVRKTLDVYLERTKSWRTDQKKLLLSYEEHEVVCKCVAVQFQGG